MLITYRRWDISSDNPVYTLINTSCNNSHVLWLGLRWNFLSFKPVGGQQKQQKDRNLIRFVDRKKRRLTKSSTSVFCVQDESRTHTPNWALPPQSSASTNSATWTKKESERRDSDPRPRPWQGRALPTELLSQSILTPLKGCFRELRCKDIATF